MPLIDVIVESSDTCIDSVDPYSFEKYGQVIKLINYNYCFFQLNVYLILSVLNF